MIILWILLYWVIGIAFMAVCTTVINKLEDDNYYFDDDWIGTEVICSFLWPVILALLLLIGFYWLIHTAVEKLVRWFMK